MTSDPTTPEGRDELRELARKAKAASFEPSWPYDGTGNWTGCVDALLGGITGQFAGAMSPDVVTALLDTLDRQERELTGYRAEEQRVREWNALVAEGNVRCTYCDLRYAERDEYPCGDARDQNPHHYDPEELTDARRRALNGDS